MQQSSINQDYGCAFCQDSKDGDMAIMMTEAVYTKHAINQSQCYVSYIDTIMKLQQPCTRQEAIACCEHQEYLHLDQRDQYLKRQYLQPQYEAKIAMLTQYYKFHSNIPRVIEPTIERILGKYHDKKREHDYKKIKRQLKEEQGISITSVQQSQSDFSDSAVQKKSRYSTLLNELDQTQIKQSGLSDSNLLKDMCKQIQRVLPSRKKDSNFQIKGNFYQDTIFQKYLKQEQMKTRQKLRQRHQQRKNSMTNNLAKRLNLNLLQARKEKREKEHPKHSRELKKKEKDNKMVYNTNIKIQIKNAMFCTEKHLQNNFQSQASRNNSKSTKKNSLFKKKLMDPSNFVDSRQPSSTFLNQVYKSSQNEKKKMVNIHQQRTNTKQSINRSQSKERKRTLTKYSTSQSQLKKGVPGSQSARRIVYNSNELNQNSVSKVPSKALSATNLKTRVISSSGSATVSLSSSSKRRNVESFEKRPIEFISNYGSSHLKQGKPQVKGKQQKINDILSRKLTLKIG